MKNLYEEMTNADWTRSLVMQLKRKIRKLRNREFKNLKESKNKCQIGSFHYKNRSEITLEGI